jgi:transposase-like protein
MALKVVSMEELKLKVVLEPERTGETVAEVCARHGISRASFYRCRRRYRAEGVAGLEPRSRRPRVSPGQIESVLEARIVELRRRHPRWGARRIHAELRRAGIERPAVATIHRALRRNHLVAPQPELRPKATKRFEREVANDLWQIDGTQVRLAGGGRPGSSTVWTTTLASCSPRSPARLRAGRRPGPASCQRAPPTGFSASSSPTTIRASPVACSGSQSSSSASWPRQASN